MTTRPNRDLRVRPDLEAMSRAAAEALVTIARDAVDRQDRLTIALSGGQTPRRLYQLLASEYRAVQPWHKTHVFWGDERYVSPEDARSNYRMAKESLLQNVPVPGDQIHPMPTLMPDIEEAAESYEEILMQHFSGQWPRFDLVLLGMGPDGHVASLFPHNPVLEEESRIVAAVRSEADPPLRLTLTLPAINHAANIWFLVAGRNKATALDRALAPHADPKASPAAAIRPIDGQLVWWVDKAAMSQA